MKSLKTTVKWLFFHKLIKWALRNSLDMKWNYLQQHTNSIRKWIKIEQLTPRLKTWTKVLHVKSNQHQTKSERRRWASMESKVEWQTLWMAIKEPLKQWIDNNQTANRDPWQVLLTKIRILPTQPRTNYKVQIRIQLKILNRTCPQAKRMTVQASRKRYLSQATISSLSMLTDLWINWKLWAMRHTSRTSGEKPLKNSLLIMFGTHKTGERSRAQWPELSRDLKEDSTRCKKEEEDLLNTCIRKKASLTNLRKVSTRASVKKVQLSRSLVLSN